MSYYSVRFQFDSFQFATFPITRGVRTLIIINFVVFLVELLLGLLLSVIGTFVPHPMLNFFPSIGIITQIVGFNIPIFLSGALWQPVTYMFLHANLIHLFFNMLWLYFFGPEVELYFSRKRFFVFYIFTGAVAVLFNFIPYVLQGYQPPVIGASGAIMGVLVAFAFINPEREFFLFPFPVPINARGIVFVVILMNLFYAFGESYQSVITHFAGMGIGYLYVKADYMGWIYGIKKKLGLTKKFNIIK